jgi:hypothetical protein
LFSKHIPFSSTGALWTSKDTQWALDEGADLMDVDLSRVFVDYMKNWKDFVK